MICTLSESKFLCADVMMWENLQVWGEKEKAISSKKPRLPAATYARPCIENPRLPQFLVGSDPHVLKLQTRQLFPVGSSVLM